MESFILRYDAMLLGEWFRTSKEVSALVFKGQEVLNMKVDIIHFDIKTLRSFESREPLIQLASFLVPEDVNPQK